MGAFLSVVSGLKPCKLANGIEAVQLVENVRHCAVAISDFRRYALVLRSRCGIREYVHFVVGNCH